MARKPSASELTKHPDLGNKTAAAARSAGVPDIVRLDAIELAQAIQARQVSCAEVMSAYLGHIERINPHVNAIVSLQDPDSLMKQARERDDALAAGRCMGWMHGFPQGIKDLAATKGIRTTQGSPILKDFVPQEDAIYVERIKRAGGIIIGKTNTPEFGLGSQTYNPVFGTTRNAHDPSKTSGGSSGGAAVALALRMLPVADGSDHGGSLRNPAAFNNVLGFRTSYGRIPEVVPDVFNSSLTVAGPMARTVPDLAMLLSVLAGYDPRAPLSNREHPAQLIEALRRDFRGVRLAWAGSFGGYLSFEPGVLDLCKRAIKVFETLGCSVGEAWPDYPTERGWGHWQGLRAGQGGGQRKELFVS